MIRKESIKVLIAGGTGAIGKHLTQLLESKGCEVTILTQKKNLADGIKYFYWNVEAKEIDERCFSNINCVIQLSGANISEKRWTSKRKIEILNSRVHSTDLLFQSISHQNLKLSTFITASAIGFYGIDRAESVCTENDSPGNDFLATTCEQWENAAEKFQSLGIRTVKIRTGIVLMQNDGFFARVEKAAKFGFGVIFGDGNQYFPWIHIDDLCGIYLKAVYDEKMYGAYNAISPSHTTNRIFIETLCRIMEKPGFFTNIPSFIIKIVFGELASTILYGCRISAEKIVKSGYVFQFDDLHNAISNLTNVKR